MPSRTVRVGSKIGLHARPAALIAEAASLFEEEVLIAIEGFDDDAADAASSLSIMALGAEYGDTVVVQSVDEAAVEKIAAMIEGDLDRG